MMLESSSFWDHILYRLFIKAPDERNLQDSINQILFICELLPARAGRMARYLNQIPGFQVELLCHANGLIPEFAEDNFVAVNTYRNKWHLRTQLRKRGRFSLIHAFAPKCEYPEIVRQESNVPFILDMQDVIVTYHGLTPPYAWARKELTFEKSCLQHTDLMVAQSLEPRIGYQRYGIEKRPKTLFFPLYCDGEAFQPNAGKDISKEIHFVYAGGIAGSHRDRRQFGILQFHNLIESLSSQKIHFHVYPSPSTLKPDYEEYYDIAAKNPYFHIHQPVTHHKLTEELAKYHFGILPFFSEDSELKDDKMVYATSLKLFNFLEAGLPVIISKDIVYQNWIVAKGNAGLSIQKSDVPNLRKQLMELDYADLLDKVKKHRTYLSLEKNLPRLTSAYENLIQSTTSSPK